jgi:hypothetical protein
MVGVHKIERVCPQPSVKRRMPHVADGRAYNGETVTDPGLDEVLRAAGFDVTEAGRQRWRAELSRPIPEAVLDDAKRLLDRAWGRAA